MTNTLKNQFIQLTTQYTDQLTIVQELWDEIESNYTSKKRHYHNLQHLENLVEQLSPIQTVLQNWDTILFSVYYHDIVYNPLKSDNEERSAAQAGIRLQQIAVPDEIIASCKFQILATKTHQQSDHPDTNYLIDADLSILGAPWPTYEQYYCNVRKEYSIYPDFVYNPGRKKVLDHFLMMGRIYKTDFFHDQFERQARHNIKQELEMLSVN